MTKYIVFAFLVLLCVYFTEQFQFLSLDHIKQINDVAITWKARQNFHPNTSIEFIISLLGAKTDLIENPFKTKIIPKFFNLKTENVPKSFDARKQWKNCKTIANIPNQGNCGSCWAFATASAFSDRLCIATNGKFNQLISIQELLSCCRTCGSKCIGGYPIKAWEYIRTNGLVTGGGFQSSEGCQPYKYKPCVNDQRGINTCANEKPDDGGQCLEYCYGNKTIDYISDHYKTRNEYYLKDINIQKDLLAHGSITAEFNAYSDFISYSSGVYVKTNGAKSLGGHAVKLIGWGLENDVPYWLLINSWGPEWGDKGTFKIRRGTNECNIENKISAGIPLI